MGGRQSVLFYKFFSATRVTCGHGARSAGSRVWRRSECLGGGEATCGKCDLSRACAGAKGRGWKETRRRYRTRKSGRRKFFVFFFSTRILFLPEIERESSTTYARVGGDGIYYYFITIYGSIG